MQEKREIHRIHRWVFNIHPCLYPSVQSALVISIALASRYTDNTENMCGRFGLASPLGSVKTLDPLADLEKQIRVYSNMLNCLLAG